MNHSETISPKTRLFDLLRVEGNDLWVAVIFSIAVGLLSLAVPVATQALVNTVAFGSVLQPLLVLSLVVLAMLTAAGILQMLRYRVVELLQRRVFVRIASDAVNRLLRARTDVLRSLNGPELVNRFLDVVTLQKSGATLLLDGLSIVMQTLLGMILLGVYHPWLLAFDAVLLVALLIVIFPLASGAVYTAVKESKSKYALVAWLEEIARNTHSFRGQAERTWAFQKTDQLVKQYLDYRSKHFKILMRQYAGTLSLQAIASAALLGGGGMLVIQRQLTLGQLVAAELVVTAVLSGISKLAKHLETFYDLLASLDKLGTLTDLETEKSGDEPSPTSGPSSVSFRSATFGGKAGPRERVGLTGLSGSGKSTLLDAICGYGDRRNWTVEHDGVDLRNLDLTSLRSNIAFVRDIEIFEGSILDNVRVGREWISLVAVQHALEQVGVWSTVQNMPEGLNTILSTGGYPLSEGQKQSIMIARAIAGSPRLLILDESLDNIQDSADRDVITNALFATDAPWTLIVVTVREDLLRRCTRVLELNRTEMPEAA